MGAWRIVRVNPQCVKHNPFDFGRKWSAARVTSFPWLHEKALNKWRNADRTAERVYFPSHFTSSTCRYVVVVIFFWYFILPQWSPIMLMLVSLIGTSSHIRSRELHVLVCLAQIALFTPAQILLFLTRRQAHSLHCWEHVFFYIFLVMLRLLLLQHHQQNMFCSNHCMGSHSFKLLSPSCRHVCIILI